MARFQEQSSGDANSRITASMRAWACGYLTTCSQFRLKAGHHHSSFPSSTPSVTLVHSPRTLYKMVKGSDILLIVVAILLPPAAVGFLTGCSCDLLINILLTLLGYIPGHIHAFWIIYKKNKAEEQWGVGGYRYVGNGTYEQAYVAAPQGGPVGYGATN